MLAPIIPETSEEILDKLSTDACGFDSIGTLESFGAIAAGSEVKDSRVMFARIDEAKLLAELEAEMEAQRAAAEAANATPEKPEGCALIGIEDFMGVELRSAKVVACERVPKAKKLLCLQLDLGYEKRQVVSGIAKFYAPEDLIGKKVIVVANLKPAKLCGVDSYGMILASGEEDIKVVFLSSDAKNGDRIH